MKITNYVMTVHWLVGKRSYLTTTFEEAFEWATDIKKKFPTVRVSLKRERRDSEYWLNLILGNAQLDI